MKGGWIPIDIFENTTPEEALIEYSLRLADTTLVLGHRLSELCSHGPVLEQDIALTNVALDLVGQARNYYQYAATLKGGDTTEDTLAYFRTDREYRNVLLVEQPNGHWGDVMARQFLFDTFNYYFTEALTRSKDEQLAAIATKALKEITYHAQFSAEWVIRLGDGTEESHQKMQQSLEDIWMWSGELFEENRIDAFMKEAGIGVDLSVVKEKWDEKVNQVLEIATLKRPEDQWMQTGGKQGIHSDHLGFLLAEMQSVPRAFPDAKW